MQAVSDPHSLHEKEISTGLRAGVIDYRVTCVHPRQDALYVPLNVCAPNALHISVILGSERQTEQ